MGDVTDDDGVVGDADDGCADGCVGVDAAWEDTGTDDDGCVGNADRGEGWVAGCADGPDPAAAAAECSPCCCAAAGAAIARTASATTNPRRVALVTNPVMIPRSLFLLT